MNTRYVVVGAILLLIALMLPSFARMAQVTYTGTTVKIVQYSPGSTDPNNPGGLLPGQTAHLDCAVKYETPDTMSNAKVKISGGWYGSGVTIDIPYWDYLPDMQIVWYHKENGFETKNDPVGTKYTLVFTATSKDGRTGTVTTYMYIIEADGQFYINDQAVTPSSKLTVTSPTLNFKFKATKRGDVIELVRIYIKDITDPNKPQELTNAYPLTLTETTKDTEWTGSYTLPKYGVYNLEGWITYGGSSYLKMSVFGSWGSNEEINKTQEELQAEALAPIQWMFGIAGVALAGYGLVSSPKRGRWS